MEFSPSQILDAFESKSKLTAKPASIVTLRQHWQVFLHSYRPPRSDKGEDHLDSAMSALRIIRESGERPDANGNWESLYCFDPARRSAISEQLFAFFVHHWWNRKYPNERTVPLRDLVLGDHSPGRLLKMQESEVLQRLAEMTARRPKVFQIVESKSLRQMLRHRRSDGLSDLKSAYKTPSFT